MSAHFFSHMDDIDILQKCSLWTEPQRIKARGTVRLVEVFSDTSEHQLSLVQCNECGMNFLYEYVEIQDFTTPGPDPVYMSYWPVFDAERLSRLKSMTHFERAQEMPMLQHDDIPGRPEAPFWTTRRGQ